MNANNVWIDSTAREEVVGAQSACVVSGVCVCLSFCLLNVTFLQRQLVFLLVHPPRTHRDAHTKLFAVLDTALLYYSL